MAEHLTREKLQELRTLAHAATADWEVGHRWVYSSPSPDDEDQSLINVVSGRKRAVQDAQAREETQAQANCELIVAMRNALPDLIDSATELANTKVALADVRAAAVVLLHREKTNGGHGRSGHLNEEDLAILFDALGPWAFTPEQIREHLAGAVEPVVDPNAPDDRPELRRRLDEARRAVRGAVEHPNPKEHG